MLGAVAPTQVRMPETERALEGAFGHGAPAVAALALSRELERRGHPLPGNAWKLDAACGLTGQAMTRLCGEITG